MSFTGPPLYLQVQILVTQEKQREKKTPTPCPSEAESLLGAKCFYVHAGEKKSVTSSKEKPFDLDFESLTVPSTPPSFPLTTRIPFSPVAQGLG